MRNVMWKVFELLSLMFLCAVLLWGMGQLVGCDDGGDLPDAGLEADAGGDAGLEADAAACGETWGRCCANDAPEGRCNPEAICNVAEVCEPMCFPYCADGGE